MEKFSDLQKKLDDMKTDIEKFYQKGQNAAGTRLRKSLNELKKVASDIRKEIQDMRASRKTEG
ncbi:MAG: histone H1 [Bacteroidetes bacterium]|nr:histone H1 [Bacteroidota bacterium]MBX7045120.1 histone H1 [Ignavibacteria bacterium]HNO71596.1 histone H1 [Bacteroidia bacterium]